MKVDEWLDAMQQAGWQPRRDLFNTITALELPRPNGQKTVVRASEFKAYAKEGVLPTSAPF